MALLPVPRRGYRSTDGPTRQAGRKPTRGFCFCSISFEHRRDPFTLSAHAIGEGKSPLSAERDSDLTREPGVLVLGAFSKAELERSTLPSISSPCSFLRSGRGGSGCPATRERKDGGGGGWGAGEFRPSPKTSSLAALGSWPLLSLDTSSTLDHPSGRLRVSVCPSGPVPKDVWQALRRRAWGADHGEGLTAPLVTKVVTTARSGGGGGGPQTVPSPAVLPP